MPTDPPATAARLTRRERIHRLFVYLASAGLRRQTAACGADVTLRDDEHQLAVCRKAATHTDAHHDAELGVTWTDGHHA